MLRALLVLQVFLVAFVSLADIGMSRCNCDEEGNFWSLEMILETQKVSDFLIAVAYFLIFFELIYFAGCSNIPVKWVLFEFIAFIVLSGITHLLSGWTYGHHSFHLMVAFTVFKILRALVTCATAITMVTLIPMLLKVKAREFMLRKKAWDLGHEVGIIMKQKEMGLHVRMLTQEIRKSLNRDTILYTTLVELSKTLGLQNCAVWTPNEIHTEIILTHDLKPRNEAYSEGYGYGCYSIPINDPDVARIKGSEEVNLLDADSALAMLTSRGEPGPIAGIRVPMLRVSNFKGWTPKLSRRSYAVLICVLPYGQTQHWTCQELEIVKIVADEVAVAISHAAILEESELMREKLVEQNRVLRTARQNCMRARQSRIAFEQMMRDAMTRPLHSIPGLLSLMQDKKLPDDNQKVIINTIVKISNALSALINDATDISRNHGEKIFPMETRSFSLRSVFKNAACLAKCLCVYKGFRFSTEVEKSLSDHVVGDETRVFQVILHMLGYLLNSEKPGRGGNVIFRVFQQNQCTKRQKDYRQAVWKHNYCNGYVSVRFEFRLIETSSGSECSIFEGQHRNIVSKEHPSFSICKQLVKTMHGNLWVVPNANQGSAQSMSVVLQFRLGSSVTIPLLENSSESSKT